MRVIANTPRLELREFSIQDAPSFYQLNLDPLVLQYTGDSAFANVGETIEFIQKYDQYDKYGFGRWSLYLKESQQYIGFCGLRYSDSTGEVDLGFRLVRRFWGQGLATEAAKCAVEVGFKHYRLESIIGRAMQDNLASHAILNKLGFQFESPLNENKRQWFQYRLVNQLNEEVEV
ncbi:GNAT family N-acetyltransferase [Aliikangiella sp. IMCC44359]|uniref:GNAT family N-acetyltransferase n=1 Tax=Aliikangiella sp. IMCC44359 TaxID=3459125 RepID=UPI00403AEE8D